jgi:hypothetical protein
MENSLSPASFVIDYHTLYAPHKMTIPTLSWFPTSITGSIGSYAPWTGSPIDAEVMIDDFVGVLEALVPATTVFDQVTVYTQADATSPNIPRASAAIGVAGSSGATGLSEANSATFNFKTLANGNFKIVLLDFPLGSGGYNAIHPATFSAEILALAAFVEDTGNAFSGRDDSRPAVLRKVTFDLNDKLQKQYRMGR